MRKIVNLSIIGVIIAVIGVLAWKSQAKDQLSISYTKDTLRYKVSIDVETPEGLKSGSAVREMTIARAEPEIQGLADTRVFTKERLFQQGEIDEQRPFNMHPRT